MLRVRFNGDKKILMTVLLTAVVLALMLWISSLLGRMSIYDGVSIGNIDVSGMNSIVARGLVQKSLKEEYENATFLLVDGEREWSLRADDFSFGFLVDEAVERAYGLGRSGNIFHRLYSIARIRFGNQTITPSVYYDKEKLKEQLTKIKKEIDIGERNASVSYSKGSLSFNKETIGRNLDIDTNLKIVENHIIKKNFGTIKLAVEERIPEIRLEAIEEIKDSLSTFQTSFGLNDANRSHNIRLASERINNILLMPGDIFSMNIALGPRTTENGYLEAPVIFKNEMVQGTGGGVCQVTSTLYVTVLKARLEILERSPHSRPLGYIPPGQDATIAEGAVDFKFQNMLDYPVCIGSEVVGNTLKIKIMGRAPEEKYTVRLVSETLEQYHPGEEEFIIDNSIPPGIKEVVRKARTGLRVAVYREILDSDGKLMKREKISEDTYKPAKAQIKINELSAGIPFDQLEEILSANAES